VKLNNHSLKRDPDLREVSGSRGGKWNLHNSRGGEELTAN